MPAGLTEPAGSAPPAAVSASGTATMAPAGALPVRVESTPVALGAVTKAPVSVCVESAASPALRSPVGTLVTKVAPVSAPPKLSSSPRLPAPQIVTVKTPNTTTLHLPANLQLPPGTVLIKSNSGQLMLVSPQQAITRTETTSNITSRPSVPTNTQTVKICTMPNSSSQVIKNVTVAPVKKLAQIGTTVVTTVPKSSSVQSVAVPTNVVKSLNTVSTLKASTLGVSSTPSNEPNLKAENLAAAQTDLSPTMLENVKKCKNFLAMLIKLACSGSQSPEMGQNVKKLVEQLLDAKIEAEEFTKKLYVELKSSPQPHLVPFLKKSVIALRQLVPNSQSFIQQCVQQTSSEGVIVTCTTTVTTSPMVTTLSSSQSEKPIIVSGVTTPRTVSVQPLNPLTGPREAKTGVVTLHSVGPAAVPGPPAIPGETTAGTVFLQTSKPLVTSVPNTVTTVSLQPEKPVVSGAAVTVAIPTVTFGETSAAAICLPSVKPVVTSAGTTSDKTVISAPVQVKITQPGPVLSQTAGIQQAVKVKQLLVQQPSGGIAKQVTALSHSSALTIQKSGQKMPVNTVIPTSQFPAASFVKQITLPGNKILSLQASPIPRNKIKENGTTSFRDEDDINDVTSMAGLNLSEENACILTTNSVVGTLIQSCKDEPFLFIGALQKRILDIGKKHDITELNSDAVNLISHATQERLRGLLEKLTAIAQHRMTTYKASENYILCSDTRSQLKFLEKLDQLEKQRKDLEEREMLLKAAKSRSNKEDPEQLRLKQKAKELQQLELAQIQHRDANLTALAAIGPRKKRPLESGNEGLKDNLLASGTSSLTTPKQVLRPRITRICLRDLIFCMEQEREMKYSRALYLALLK
ncbi:transcription initiation factor TFIID subunit 4B [Nycticebus coucang]|uniref:transcription initiation factor TFIID subunit 4B n=1 Tax=Nycticebus coucang TaxID=9470 RepID=UPI00234D8D66|nr:transcription initiation factor TFIID subunit 4B [Nycticebus coucang]